MLVLKIILISILALLLVVTLALFLPVTVFFSFDKKVVLRVYYCGISVFSTAKKKKKKPDKSDEESRPQKKEKKSDTKKDKPNFFKKIYDKLGFVDTVHYFAGLLKLVLLKLGWVLKRLKIRKFRLSLTVGTSDAAQTAIQYGRICSAVYPVLSMLFSIADCKAKKADISADFNHSSSNFSISFIVRALPIYFVVAALTGLWEYKKYKGVNLDERKQS